MIGTIVKITIVIAGITGASVGSEISQGKIEHAAAATAAAIGAEQSCAAAHGCIWIERCGGNERVSYPEPFANMPGLTNGCYWAADTDVFAGATGAEQRAILRRISRMSKVPHAGDVHWSETIHCDSLDVYVNSGTDWFPGCEWSDDDQDTYWHPANILYGMPGWDAGQDFYMEESNRFWQNR